MQQWNYYGSNKLHKTQFVPGTVNPVKRPRLEVLGLSGQDVTNKHDVPAHQKL